MKAEIVTPSRVCELKCLKSKLIVLITSVTPSRVCELKFTATIEAIVPVGHTLTGV